MKKFIVVVALLALVAGSAFAGVTTATKLQSQANYPGVLVAGSVIGADTFVTDIALMPNVALLEVVDGDAYGLTVLKTDLGTFAASVADNSLLGLGWATALEGMNVAAGLKYGVVANGTEIKDEVLGAATSLTSNYNQTLDLTLGAALQGDMPLDLSLNFGLAGTEAVQKDYAIDKSITEVTTDTVSGMNIGAAGRMGLGDGLKAVLDVNYTMASLSHKEKEADTSSVTDGNALSVAALIGKDIKASESLTVKMASGVSVLSDSVGIRKNEGTATTYDLVDTDSATAIVIPFNFAVEGKLNETWSVSSGVNAQILAASFGAENFFDGGNTGNDSNSTKVGRTSSAINILNDLNPGPGFNYVGYAIGTTAKIGDLTLDLNVNPMILMNGPEFISGNGVALNTDLAVVYGWK